MHQKGPTGVAGPFDGLKQDDEKYINFKDCSTSDGSCNIICSVV